MNLDFPLRTKVRFVSWAFCLKNSRDKICNPFFCFEDAQNLSSSAGGGDSSNKLIYFAVSTSGIKHFIYLISFCLFCHHVPHALQGISNTTQFIQWNFSDSWHEVLNDCCIFVVAQVNSIVIFPQCFFYFM